jgi:hypothetical protein
MSTENTYDVGDVVRLRGIFKDAAGALANPTTTRLKVLVPKTATTPAVEVTYTYGVDGGLVRNSVGDHSYDYPPAVPGRYFYRWIGTGAIVTADEKSFLVRKTAFSSPI